MAIIKMKKLELIGLESGKEAIIKSLMKMGVVEIENIHTQINDEQGMPLAQKDGDEALVASLDGDIASVHSALLYLEKYAKVKKKLFQPKRIVSSQEFEITIKSKDRIWDVVQTIDSEDEVLTSLRTEENKLTNLIATLEPWRALDIPLHSENTKSTVLFLGVVPAVTEVEQLKQQVMTEVDESHIELVSRDNEQAYLMVLSHQSREEEVGNLLKQYGFTKTQFKDITGTPQEVITKSQKRIVEIEKEREEKEKGIASLSHEKPNVEMLFDYLVMERDKKRILGRLLKTDKTFLLEGWLPAEQADLVVSTIEKSNECYIVIRELQEDEEAPVLIRNPAIVEPFEIITELYSLPKSKGIDPNLFMAPFYFLFFGMMVSDAGYGFLLSLVTGIVLLRFKPTGMLNKLLRLIFLGGISTFLWGVMFGGWFGNFIDIITGKTSAIPPLWFNPLENPMRLLLWSFIFGALHIFTGMGLKAYMLIRDGKWKDAVYDVFSWYLLIIGLVLFGLGGSTGDLGKYMALAGTLTLVLTQGRTQKTIIKRLFSGVLSLYNITGFLSDILSYSRLLALGLATGVIATVINTMGTLFGFGVMGIIILIAVFIFGTVFNIAINALGAYVHASRLQYVEFFGKFYEGGGKAFEPFRINSKYINITDRRQM